MNFPKFIERLQQEGPDLILSGLLSLKDIKDFKRVLIKEIAPLEYEDGIARDSDFSSFTSQLRDTVKQKPTLLIKLISIIRQSRMSKEDLSSIFELVRSSSPDAVSDTNAGLQFGNIFAKLIS